MLSKLGLAAAISIMATMPAWAQSGSCGGEPIPPAIPSAAEIGQKAPAEAAKAKHQAFLDVTTYQKGGLKDYRDCLDASKAQIMRDIQKEQQSGKPDKDKIKKMQDQVDASNHAYDHSTDTEERLVNDWNALKTAFCSRKDVDLSSCPKT